MQIHIIAVGKVKERWLREGIEEYQKRLRSYATIRIQEVADEPVPMRSSETKEEKVRDKEGISLLAAVPSGAWVAALHPGGLEITSEEFAQRLQIREVEGPHTVVFLIGGELGLSARVQEEADILLSLSRMTFPHRMVRLLLLEALYRAFRLMRGEPYHR
jgi:23S rRNA (pseudouridine1915-N3)-methyltransferase